LRPSPNRPIASRRRSQTRWREGSADQDRRCRGNGPADLSTHFAPLGCRARRETACLCRLTDRELQRAGDSGVARRRMLHLEGCRNVPGFINACALYTGGLTEMHPWGSDLATMPSLRAFVASALIPGIVLFNLFNCTCLCSPSAGAQSRQSVAASSRVRCRGGDGAPGSSQHGRLPHDPSSGACPHCDHAQVVAAKGDNGTGLLAAPQLPSSMPLVRIVAADEASAPRRRPIAVIHSPPALALLRQKCVLLI
jgi:hypothetical protein